MLPLGRRRRSPRRELSATVAHKGVIVALVPIVAMLLHLFDPNSQGQGPRSLWSPSSIAGSTPADAVVLIDRRRILFDGAEVASTIDIETGNAPLPRLASRLRQRSEERIALKFTGAGAGVGLLIADADVPASVVKSVFRTLGENGYPRVSLLVQQ